MDRPLKRSRTTAYGASSPSCPESSPANAPSRKAAQVTAVLPSPWHFTLIRDLPNELNRDAISLAHLLGDPLIRECWQFNFLYDISFLMDAFDPDTRHLVRVHIVHGFSKADDARRLILSHDAAVFSNVHLHTAPMPELFGTHHTKMMILFRQDDTAEIVIHTANMIPHDWTNMTNAVWTSPRLPRLQESVAAAGASRAGHAFQSDLLGYLRSYNRRSPICKPLVEELDKYDFSNVKAALVASVPGRHDRRATWGWAALQKQLKSITCEGGEAEVTVQVSSMATLGAKDDWLQKTLFDALASCRGGEVRTCRPKFKIVYPTADEIRRSLDGYASGSSIHTKIQSPQQGKQLDYLRPMLHHWANDSPNGKELQAESKVTDSGRNRAAPHVKTYIRYNADGSLAWALLTSANLSKQAWGEARKPTGEMRIASWELGVLVWPGLFGEGSVLEPVSGSDTMELVRGRMEPVPVVVGLRIPYSRPLQPYGPGEVPWVASMAHREPDSLGRVWEA